jgi:hypothetical protein
MISDMLYAAVWEPTPETPLCGQCGTNRVLYAENRVCRRCAGLLEAAAITDALDEAKASESPEWYVVVHRCVMRYVDPKNAPYKLFVCRYCRDRLCVLECITSPHLPCCINLEDHDGFMGCAAAFQHWSWKGGRVEMEKAVARSIKLREAERVAAMALEREGFSGRPNPNQTPA